MTEQPRPLRKKPAIKHHHSRNSSDDEAVYYQRGAPTLEQSPTNFDRINFIALETFEEAIENSVVCTAFKNTIERCSHAIVGQPVLHLAQGCDCLYSLFALLAGAEIVYCVVNGSSEADEQNKHMMRQILAENGFKEDRAKVMSLKDFNAQVNVIIAEPMGHCLFYDGLLDRIIQCRDMFLKEGGIIIPGELTIKASLIHDEYFRDKKVDFWGQVEGVSMASVKKWVSKEPSIRLIDPSLVCGSVHRLVTYNIATVHFEEINVLCSQWAVNFPCQTTFNGLTIWFECNMSRDTTIVLRSSPWSEATKFAHCTLYLPQPSTLKGKVNLSFKGSKQFLSGATTLQLNVEAEKYIYQFC